jgi:hypothetical protein
MSKTSIETATGKSLDYAAPTKEMLDVESIAWGVSRQPRFCGQTVGDLPYSVAQHSSYVTYLIGSAMMPGTSHHKIVLNHFTKDSQMVKYLNDDLQLEKDVRLGMKLGHFHDGSEAFLCDIPTPAKRLPGLMEAYHRVESALMGAIHDLIGITPEMITPELQKIVHWADAYALAVEAYHLVPSRGKSYEWAFLPKADQADVLNWPGPMKTSYEAFIQFMTIYETLFTSQR